MLSQLTPRDVRLSRVQFALDGGKPVCHVQGTAADGGRGAEASLKMYLDSLAGAPMVGSFTMGRTERDVRPGGPVQSFEVALTLVDLPAAIASGADQEAR
jgi:hypothetical protein